MVVAALLSLALQAPPRLIAVPNDNRVAAGTTVGGARRIRLVVQRARWYPDGDRGPSVETEAMGEEGKPLTVPGPLVRVPVGTRVDATIRNALPDTIVFAIQCAGCPDSVHVAPGETRPFPIRTDRIGTYSYASILYRNGKPWLASAAATQTGGAIVIDAPDAPAVPNDRVMVITEWVQHFDTTRADDEDRLVMTINGRMWPGTERFRFTVGDTVRWRIVDASGDTHPMHLHGFYFRVDSRGDGASDSVYADGDRRWAVTEETAPNGTFSLTWIPQRLGNWIFHCHKAVHVGGFMHDHLAGTRIDDPFADAHAEHESSDSAHVATGMGGLVVGIEVAPRAGAVAIANTSPTPPARRLRLLVQRRPGREHSTLGYVLQRGDSMPAADSVQVPGPPLVLTRGEPVEITVLNRLDARTGVHWHGIELDSYYDGVGGWSGAGARVAPRVAPNDSFVVRFTPPRAGTFMYHSHADEVRQLALGLYGPLIVLEPGATWDPSTDHALMIGSVMLGGDLFLGLNGSPTGYAMRWAAGRTHRLRLLNVTIDHDARVTLMDAAGVPVQWTRVAKDGADLPATQRTARPAQAAIAPGETMDAEVTLQPGRYQLRVTSNVGNVLRTVIVE